MEMAQEKKDRVVLLSKASGAGDGYYPVAAARAQDLRRQITGVVESEGSTVLVEPIPLAPAVMAAGGGGGKLSAVVGILAASSAVTALAGGAVSPAVAFGWFLVLLGGLALAEASVGTAPGGVGSKAGDPIPLAPVVMAARGNGGNLSAVVGIVAAPTAVTALAGGAVSPLAAFGSFLVLLGGVALAMASVRATT